MAKKFFKYLDVQLWRRWKYTPSYTITIPALEWKAKVEDEQTIGITTPNSVFNLGYVEIIDPTIETTVDELFTLWGMHGIKAITVEEARTMLDENGYLHDGSFNYTIREEITEMGFESPAVTLAII